MKHKLSLLILLAGCLAGSLLNAAPVPPTDNTAQPYMGIYGWSPSSTGINHGAYTASWLYRSGLWVQDFADYSSWASLEGPSWLLTPIVNWKRQNPNGVFLFTVGILPGSGNIPLAGTSLALGATGTFNSHWTTLATNLVNRGLADCTILRLGHEFNGTWYPWKVASQADALNYAAYWQQIVTTMRAVPGAENLKFDWNGAASQWTSYSVANAYPGDDYVDYVGCDIYDQSWMTNTYPYPADATDAQKLTCQTTAWNFLASTSNNGIATWKNLASTHSKPFTIPEWGVCNRSDGHGGLDNPFFIQKMYNLIQDPANNVYYHNYFDIQAGDGHHQLTKLPAGAATEFPNSAALFRKLFGLQPLPVNADIGTVGLSGSSDPVTVYGAGAGFVAGTSDNFHYAARTVTGDDMLIARIDSMTSGTAMQSGLMLRQSTAANAAYAALFISNGQCIFQSRTASGGTALKNYILNSATTPLWLKMLRRGNLVTGYQSTDGLNWTFAGSQNVAMTGTAYFGVAVSGGSETDLNTTAVDHVDDPHIDITSTGGITNALILDNAASTGVTKAGTWVSSTSTAGYYGDNYLTDGNANKGLCSVSFSPTLPNAGSYDVYTRWTVGYNRADNVPLTIASSSGTTPLMANQEISANLWNHVGTYSFASGTAGSLTIGNANTNGYTIVDAAMFTPAPAPPFPAPKMNADIGSPALTGSATYSNGVYQIFAGGSDIYYTSDQFHYVYQGLTGANQTLVARVTGFTNTNSSAKAGVMFRKSLASNSSFVMFGVTPTGYAEMVFRTSDGASAGYTGRSLGIIPSESTPIWVKLVKTGDNFYGYYATTVSTPQSSDWLALGTLWITGYNSYHGGLAVTSRNVSAQTTAVFDNVTP